MKSRRTVLKSATALVALSLFSPTMVWADSPTPVVATFSILGDMVERIGGDHVTVTTLVGPDGDAHVYQPTPKDARAVNEADVLFVNGLEFEGWLERLSEAADFKGTLVVATTGIEAIPFEEGDDHDDHGDDHAEAEHDHDDHDDEKHADHDDHDHDKHEEHAEAEHDHDHDHEKHADHDDHDHDKHEEHAEAEHDHDDHDHEKHADHDDHDHDKHEEHAEAEHDHDDHEEHAGHDHHGHDHGAFDPHAWQSLDNAVIYVDNITAALAKADPAHAGFFYENREAYVAEIEALDAEIKASMEALPEERRTVVTSHDAFQYFGRDYGLTFLAPQGVSTESEASAQDVARLIEQMREDNISAVFVENITDSRLLEQIANETGATVGGSLYPGALSGEDGPAATYLDMMRHNAKTLTEALGS